MARAALILISTSILALSGCRTTPIGDPISVALPHNLGSAAAQELVTQYLSGARELPNAGIDRKELQQIRASATRSRAVTRRYRGTWRIESWEPQAIVAAYSWKRHILRVQLRFTEENVEFEIGKSANLRYSGSRIHPTAKVLATELAQEIRFVFGQVASHGKSVVAGQAPRKESVCSAMWRSDPSEQTRCQRAQKRSYDRLKPIIDLVRVKPASSEAQRFSSCYARAQTQVGTDWESTERCFHSSPASAR